MTSARGRTSSSSWPRSTTNTQGSRPFLLWREGADRRFLCVWIRSASVDGKTRRGSLPRRSIRFMNPDVATSTGTSARERLDALAARLGVRGLVLLSLAFLVPQQLLTRYPRREDGANVLWLVVGCLLLWFIYRRNSSAARAFSVYPAVIGALIYASQVPREGSSAAVLALLFLGQAPP